MDQLKYDLQQKEEEALLDDEMQVETHTKVGKIVPIDAAPSPPAYGIHPGITLVYPSWLYFGFLLQFNFKLCQEEEQ